MNSEIVYFVHIEKPKFDLIKNKVQNCLYFVKNGDTYSIYKGDNILKLDITNNRFNELIDQIKVLTKQEVKSDINNINARLDNLLNNAPRELDTLREIANDLKGKGTLLNRLEQTTSSKLDTSTFNSFKRKTEQSLTSQLTSINNKANNNHTHQISDIPNLQNALNGKVDHAQLNSKLDQNTSNLSETTNHNSFFLVNDGNNTKKMRKETVIGQLNVYEKTEIDNKFSNMGLKDIYKNPSNINPNNVYTTSLYGGQFSGAPSNYGVLLTVNTTYNSSNYYFQIFCEEGSDKMHIRYKNGSWNKVLTKKDFVVEGTTLKIDL